MGGKFKIPSTFIMSVSRISTDALAAPNAGQFGNDVLTALLMPKSPLLFYKETLVV